MNRIFWAAVRESGVRHCKELTLWCAVLSTVSRAFGTYNGSSYSKPWCGILIWTIIHVITTAEGINISARPLVCKLTASLPSNLKLHGSASHIWDPKSIFTWLLPFKISSTENVCFHRHNQKVCLYLTGLRKWIMNRQARERVFLGQNSKRWSGLIAIVTYLYYFVIWRGVNCWQPRTPLPTGIE